MTRVKTLCLSLLFLFVAVFMLAKSTQAAVPNTNDLYWISYGTFNPTDGNAQFLMQIDSTGKIVRAPKKVSKDFGPTISEAGPNTINLWGFNQRTIIDKKTLSVVKTVKTGIAYVNEVTQKAQQNFVTTPYLSNDSRTPTLQFFGVSPTGVPNLANTWVISSEGDCSLNYRCPSGAVSSDGKMIFWPLPRFFETGSPGTSIQLLTNSGRSNGAKKFFAAAGSGPVFNGVVSNVLPSGRVFAVYGQGFPGQLFLQIIDAQTGNSIGDGILLAKGLNNSSFAIDPLGQFVIYARKKVMFQALDATGHPSGAAKPLVSGSLTGIDILKDFHKHKASGQFSTAVKK